MSVVNCKVKYIRPEYNDLKEWMEDVDKNVYIGRKGVVFVCYENKKERWPKQDSPFCNPFKVGKDGTREEVIKKYKKHLKKNLEEDETLVHELKKMKGKNLGCWCAPEACHGDVLLSILNESC